MPNNPDVAAGMNILNAWTALEVLSPMPFDRKNHQTSKIDEGKLPWQEPRLNATQGSRLYYQVIIGSISVSPAVDALLRIYSDSREERPIVKGEAILAVAVLDHNGILLESSSVGVSSFGWGYPKALKGDLVSLQNWAAEEQIVTAQLDKILRRKDEDDNPIPIDMGTLQSAYSFLVKRFELSREVVSPPRYAVRQNLILSIKEPPEPLILNSFYIKDLIAASKLLEKRKSPLNLKKYLSLTPPIDPKQILADQKALREIVSPSLIPSGRWPGPGRHPLALLQQAAVNAAMRDLKSGGIIGVNGPPGTGKTTLLRDIIAGIVVKRAEALCTFDNPDKAFKAASKIVLGGNAFLYLYELDEKIKGHEILIASSNNKAVENVSKEIPGINAIATDAADLRYFSTLSDSLINADEGSWGLIAAVLGNGTNRSRFKQIFWWDKEVGMQTYLKEVSGSPQLIDEVDQKTGTVISRPPRIIQREKPPTSPDEAAQRWQNARLTFQATVKKSRERLKELADLEKTTQNFPVVTERERTLCLEIEKLQKTKGELATQIRITQVAHSNAEKALQLSEHHRHEHQKRRPGILSTIFKTAKFKKWAEEHANLMTHFLSVQLDESKAKKVVIETEDQAKRLQKQIETVTQDYKPAKFSFDASTRIINKARDSFKDHLLEDDFFSKSHQVRQKTSPWCDDVTHRLRDEVFIAAMKVHKAFIDASAQKIRHNIGVLMSSFATGSLKTDKDNALLPDLWSTLFLVVPCLSTTFASVEKMLGKLPPESLGWLLIDEAGQALPQAAVGAITRTKRALVVGDPIQIQPVVTLPETLTRAICEKFQVDADKYNAPDASVQTLADAATNYYHEFGKGNSNRRVGIPLLVHRRCSSPMFEVSNTIAYDGEMVQAKQESKQASPIKSILGNSRWIHIEGQSQDKWCPEEGQAVLELLQTVKLGGARPNLYIVTPFVTVAENLRLIIRSSELLNQWVEEPEIWLKERIGTVHTVQGREEEAIIFVLGAPMPGQYGARAWAGSPANLLNVAVTRAKEVFYVIGNRKLWKDIGSFTALDIFP